MANITVATLWKLYSLNRL